MLTGHGSYGVDGGGTGVSPPLGKWGIVPLGNVRQPADLIVERLQRLSSLITLPRAFYSMYFTEERRAGAHR